MDPLRAAQVRFTTLDPSLWPRVARNLAALGFTAVDVPLVWREHERGPGAYDLTTGRHDVGAMLDAVAAAGLLAVVRLGPWATDDAVGLGIPERVLRDRACQARTRRQNPVLVADAPRLVPLPSLASRAYRREAERWVDAAAAALARHVASGTVARVALGHGPHAPLRDDAFDLDHHPDGDGDGDGDHPPDGDAAAAPTPPHDGPADEARARVEREAARHAAFLLGLATATARAGVPERRLALAVPGSVLASPVAAALGARFPLVVAAPPANAGATALWRDVRYALALPRGAHVELRVGFPPHGAPARATHAAEAARLALAAGARDYTVRVGCAGDHWVGALLDERGEPRAHAPHWKRLNAWAASLPGGDERAATLVVPAAHVTAARAATAVHPLPLGLLAAWLGVGPGALAAEGAPGDGATLPETERSFITAERALTLAGVPWRRALGDAPAFAPGDEAAWADEAAAALADVTPAVQPQGAALVRAVESREGTHLVLVACGELPAHVTPPAQGTWRLAGTPSGVPPRTVTLAPGEAAVLVRGRAS